MRSAYPDRQVGFTLVEMLVAMAIFGVMAVAGYRVLDTVLVTRERVTDEYGRWRDVARAVAWMERDLEAVQARPIRNPSDQVLAPLLGVDGFTQPEEPAISFTRGGGLDASGAAAPPSRIGYRVRDGALERLAWPALDQATQSVPTVAVVLRGVSKLGLRYRDAVGTWRSTWPAVAAFGGTDAANGHVARSGAVDVTLPTGVDVTIQLAGGERIQRLVPLYFGPRS